MKKLSFIFPLFILLFFVFSSSCQDKPTQELEIPIYSFTEPIVNPPDEFMIVFNISWVGTREASITFEENTVWKIEKLGDGRADVFIRNGQDFMPLVMVDTLGIQGNVTYKIEIKTNYVGESNNYFLQFKKTDIEFEEFEPCF